MSMEKQGVIDERTPDEAAGPQDGKEAADAQLKDHPATRAATAVRGACCCDCRKPRDVETSR